MVRLRKTGAMGAVVSVFEPGMVNVKLHGSGTRTFHYDELEHATWPKGKDTTLQADPDKLAEQKRAVIEELRRLQKERRQSGIVVGLTGLKQVGKDSFASRLVARHGFVRLAFADNVRQVALAIDPYIGVADLRLSKVVQYGGWERAKELPEVRQLLQRIGTEGIRTLDPGFWVRPVLTEAVNHDRVVITDVRFRNEADAIKKIGGTVVRILRPSIASADQHASETDMDGYPVDDTVLNDGELADLYTKATAMAARWVL